MIALTDGNDTASQMPPERAAEIAKDRGVVVHTVGIGDPSATGEDKVDLETLKKHRRGHRRPLFLRRGPEAARGHLRDPRPDHAARRGDAVVAADARALHVAARRGRGAGGGLPAADGGVLDAAPRLAAPRGRPP